MAEEYENYADMEALARDALARLEGDEEGVALNADLRALEECLHETIEALLHKFEELHARVWRFEDRLKALEERLDGLDSPRRGRH